MLNEPLSVGKEVWWNGRSWRIEAVTLMGYAPAIYAPAIYIQLQLSPNPPQLPVTSERL